MQRRKIDSEILLAQNAAIIERANLHQDVAVSRWRIGPNAVTYLKEDSHTLSMYNNGGETSHRADRPASKGAPGSICLMPQGHESEWHINGAVDFVHLYFTDRLLKQFAATYFDCDVRFIELADLTYQDDARLRTLLARYVNDCRMDSGLGYLFAEQALNELLHYIVATYNGYSLKEDRVQGGLSPKHIRRVKALINDRLDTSLTLETLASEVGLSSFHFARMFKTSFSETPAQFIQKIRVDKVKKLLKQNVSLAEAAMMSGFSHQSHMTQQFKKHVGVTPKTYKSISA